MPKRVLLLVFVGILLSVGVSVNGNVAVAQDDACPTIVAEALVATDNVCSGIGRNEACYGNVQITAELADSSLIFEKQGDIVELTDIERMTLAPYSEETSAWGVALMNVQANIPDTMPGQGVTFLLFGDVDITNAGDSMEAFYFSSGVGTAGCNEAQSGILISTPKGAGTVSLIANDVTIELGSTAVLTASPDDVMTIALTEGNATVTADGVSQEFEGDFQVTVPINEDLEAVGAPSEPEPIPEETTEALSDITDFVSDEEADGEDTADTSEIAAGGEIVPLTGNWSNTIDTVSTSDGCPPGMGEVMTSSMNTTTYNNFEGSFSLQTMMENISSEGLPGDITYGNPAPNVFTMTYTADGAIMNWTTTLLSETLMASEFIFDLSGVGLSCTISVTFNGEYQG